MSTNTIDRTTPTMWSLVGAGGCGLRATVGLAEPGSSTDLLDQGLPPRASYGGGAGGIYGGARHICFVSRMMAMAYVRKVKGSDWLGDQDAIQFM